MSALETGAGGAKRTEVWAHRGSTLDGSLPENTLAAYEAALHLNADGIELDVHLTRDHRVVCVHDGWVNRDGRRVYLSDLTLADLTDIRVDVPVLEDVLDLLTGSNLALNVEIKDGRTPYPGIEAAVLDLTAGVAIRKIVYSSFNHVSLLTVREQAPSADIAPLYIEALVDPWAYAHHVGAHAVHPKFETLAMPNVLAGFETSGIAVRAWTVNDPAHCRWLFSEQIDAVITDDVATACAIRDEVGAAQSRGSSRLTEAAGTVALGRASPTVTARQRFGERIGNEDRPSSTRPRARHSVEW